MAGMEGYLKKEGMMFSTRLYFVLSGAELACYRGLGDTVACEVMKVTTATVVVPHKSGNKSRFKVKTGQQSWHLASEKNDETDAKQWMDAIQATIVRLSNPLKSPIRRLVLVGRHEFYMDPRYEVTTTQPLGEGAYGVVAAAKETSTGRAVAIKKCMGVFDRPSDAKKFAREIRLMRQLEHPNIVKLVTLIPPVSPAFTELYIVSELMDIDLHKLLHVTREPLTHEHIQSFTYQMLCGLKYLHSLNVIHRDLKPMNILLNKQCDVKICDFGLARGISAPDADSDDLQQPPPRPQDILSEYVETRWYRAPEVLLNPGNYGKPIDVWAIGTIMGEMMARRPMFPVDTYDQLVKAQTRILGTPTDLSWVTREEVRNFVRSLPAKPKQDFNKLFPKAPPLAHDLLQQLLEWDPNKRPTATDALNHPFFADIRSAEFETDGTAPIVWGDLEGMRTSKSDLRRFLLMDVVSMNPDAAWLLEGMEAISPAAPAIKGA